MFLFEQGFDSSHIRSLYCSTIKVNLYLTRFQIDETQTTAILFDNFILFDNYRGIMREDNP